MSTRSLYDSQEYADKVREWNNICLDQIKKCLRKARCNDMTNMEFQESMRFWRSMVI